MRALAVLLAALLAFSAVSGARINMNTFGAPAPAPGMMDKPAADLLFTLAAAKASFTAADRLALEGLSATAQAFNTQTRASGTYALGAFANTTTGAAFASVWAGMPDALMYATRDGSRVQVLVRLSQPAYDAAANQLTFAVRVLPGDAQQLQLTGGATARAADDAANGLAGSLLTDAPVGAELTSVALFIDEASSQVTPAAATKSRWGWYNSRWSCWGWDCPSWSPSVTNINNNNVGNGGNSGSQTDINNNNVVNGRNSGQTTNINNNNVGNGGNSGSPTNVNNNSVVNGGGNSGQTTNINNNNVGNGGNSGSPTNINNNNVVNGGNFGSSTNINNNNVNGSG